MSVQTPASSSHEPPDVAAPTPITVEQAAARLGVSANTVKRRIRAGILRGEQARRPQGTVWLVYLDPASMGASEERPAAATVAAPTAATPSAQAEAMVSLIQTTIATILGPLVAEQAALRQLVERQADQLVSQAVTIGRQSERVDALDLENGRLGTELAAEKAAHSPVAADLTPDPAPLTVESPGARLRALAPWVLALLAIAVVVVLLTVPR